MIEITPDISIDDTEIEERFMRAAGPGGQKVNKTESAVQLRFDARHSPALSNAQFLRLKTLVGRRMTADGVVVITARRFRTQEQNRQDAMGRLIALVRAAAAPPKRRVATKTPKAQKRKRLDNKRRKSAIKKTRGSVTRDD
ncbi:MAG: aminoacyl-tRNA hydrolase [Rhodospirillales bacterium]|nr:aminoacyl-tRNA hydrolase [Rhodospirillales bacterium]MBO6787598.1 aminoacyl-tRNA hydrolase [Rhodospirillales bacterium]